MQSQNSNGPELRGSTIDLNKIIAKTDVSNRHTKIICTLGPACWQVDQLETLIKSGMSVARFNFSHGDHEGHQACLDRLRQAAKNQKSHVGKSLFIQLTMKAFWRLRSRLLLVDVHRNKIEIKSFLMHSSFHPFSL